MKDHEGDNKEFCWHDRAWRGDSIRHKPGWCHEISFGYYAPEGGTSGEMSMVWYDLSGDAPAPRLEVFDDGWHALYCFQDVLEKLGELDGTLISPEEFCRLLESCGFKDRTPYRRR